LPERSRTVASQAEGIRALAGSPRALTQGDELAGKHLSDQARLSARGHSPWTRNPARTPPQKK
jgi:hypothetical protein